MCILEDPTQSDPSRGHYFLGNFQFLLGGEFDTPRGIQPPDRFSCGGIVGGSQMAACGVNDKTFTP